MAEANDDLMIKSIQQTINLPLGLIPETTRDDQSINSIIPADQIDDSHLQQSLEATKLENFTNLSQIEPKSNEIKRHRRNRKGLKKHLNDDFERQSVCDCDKRGDRARVVYKREELEGLRWYVGMEQQKKKWIEVYCGLELSVAKEYDHLVASNSKHGNYVNFDPRPQFSIKKGIAADSLGMFFNL